MLVSDHSILSEGKRLILKADVMDSIQITCKRFGANIKVKLL